MKDIIAKNKERGKRGFRRYIETPRCAAYARSCGGEGYRCETPEELNEALAEGMGSDKPVIFDVVVDPEKMAPHVTSGV